MIEGTLKPDQEESAKALSEAVKPLYEGIADVSYKVKVELGAGAPYKAIENVVPIKGGDPVNLDHKEGEVWLIDFWATWCPPCQAPM